MNRADNGIARGAQAGRRAPSKEAESKVLKKPSVGAESVSDDTEKGVPPEFASRTGELLALAPESYQAEIGAATPEKIPPEVLVLCIRELTRQRQTGLAEHTLGRLLGANFTEDPREPRYIYIGALRRLARRMCPRQQVRYTEEDLFQESIILIIRQMHTNVTAVKNWARFCSDRMRDARRSQWGDNLERVQMEIPGSHLLTPDDSEKRNRAPLDTARCDSLHPNSDDDGLEEWVLDVQHRVCEELDDIAKAIMEDLWLSVEGPSKIAPLARRLGVSRDRVYNVRRDATLSAAAIMKREGGDRVDPAWIDALIARMAPRRGSKHKDD